MPYADPSFDLLKHLKCATAPLHAFLDSHLPLSAESPSLNDYRAHLYLLQQWYRALNAKLSASVDIEIRQCLLSNNQALALIRQDLRQLDGDAAATDFGVAGDPAETVPAEPVVAKACFWGMEYVIKGSALGAKFLYKKLLSRQMPAALHFFRHAAGHGGRQWSEFAKKIQDRPLRTSDIAEAERGAIWAFEKIIELNKDAMPR